MYKILINNNQISLLVVAALVAILISSCNDGGQVWARTTTMAVSRKPPFNGSIFGKRSNAAPFIGLAEALRQPQQQQHQHQLQEQQQQQLSATNSNSHLLVTLLQQKDAAAAIRATISRCLAQYDSDSMASEICDELLAYLSSQPPNNPRGNTVDSLMSLIDRYDR